MNTLIDIGINLTNMPRVQYCRNEPAFLPYVAQAIARIKKSAFLKWQLKPQKRPGNFSVYKKS